MSGLLILIINLQVPIVQSKLEQTKAATEPIAAEIKSPPAVVSKDASKTSCIVCKKPARTSSIYCSNTCIWKHAQDSLGNQNTATKGEGETGKSSEKQKAESRVSCYIIFIFTFILSHSLQIKYILVFIVYL